MLKTRHGRESSLMRAPNRMATLNNRTKNQPAGGAVAT
jgi:hypothetical protein